MFLAEAAPLLRKYLHIVALPIRHAVCCSLWMLVAYQPSIVLAMPLNAIRHLSPLTMIGTAIIQRLVAALINGPLNLRQGPSRDSMIFRGVNFLNHFLFFLLQRLESITFASHRVHLHFPSHSLVPESLWLVRGWVQKTWIRLSSSLICCSNALQAFYIHA